MEAARSSVMLVSYRSITWCHDLMTAIRIYRLPKMLVESKISLLHIEISVHLW